ncbi:diaminopimelate decarboxylase [candidate division WOR-1 bacterium RIFOXYA12_FULL_43_27]|uniref:Diaminopimelate decarboxylase n=1 Tax=candidate division WOR-1 bacterium RIFOXYC2_FULL_46_14 TaxID=1802587 RepID=A0A1F4U5Z5_UNCSA|nr:MAG: diaminopimelate decarboxylase [candidate division WOR-1 bacterium RIFOXYA12_FULL_43_27]OGC20394.1 MAG: diaminopimelate decarboxylase [candidate division WOR-1 bacterium RIFOXYB2_FULL_46_45]OGC31869.1 MAG: diaminopimelate decarboxylase [candidate division WOR-1 bacterium RIFOXYA2_FULL_46_56]OGC40240.1 MAG: diaminopimelate decarboxylase [candidate division WOR-1 bacterium RIFOXYC2_FULL_46_14]
MNNRPLTAKINDKGHLEIGGCDTTELAKQFGTPLYVLDELTVRHNCRQYVSTLKSKYPDSLVIYASKALCNTAILKMIADEGLGADVSSGGELFTAKKAGIGPEKIYFHGNNKSRKEIEEGIAYGVKFVVDNFRELKNLDEISSSMDKQVEILFRVNPGIEAHTHEFIQTGKIDSKFGLQKSEVASAVKIAKDSKRLDFIGLHAHIGSQILDIDPYLIEVDILFSLAEGAKELNLGGGWGISYLGEEVPPVPELLEKVIGKVKAKKNFAPRLVFEPGRSIVGQAGITLYTVSYVKDIPGIRKYAMVDGGMSDNPRPILYDARYDAVVANRNEAPKITYRVAGRFCESGDVLIKEIKLPEIKEDDLLAVFATGAYNYSMSSNYNRVPRPAMVMVGNGKAVSIIKRETYENLVEEDLCP